MREKIHEIYEVTDLKDLLNKNDEKHSDKNAVKMKTKKDSKFDYITHGQRNQMVNSLGTSLIDLGLKGKKIGIISENRYEWSVGYMAIVAGTGIAVPLDKSLPENELLELIKRSEIEGIIFSQHYADTMTKALKDETNNLKILINMDLKKNEDVKEKTKTVDMSKTVVKKEVYKIFSLNDLITQGGKKIKKGNTSFLDAKVSPEDTACILFTSGTTSKSKAVELTHKNLVSNIMDIASVLEVKDNDIFMSFLPLHHTFECTTEMLYSFYSGFCVAYCTSLKSFASDIKDYQITCMVAVPILVEGVYKKILKNAKKQDKLEKIQLGMKLSNLLMHFGIDVRKKVFKEIHEILGGHLRLIVVGGAAFDKEVINAFNSFGIATYQGYGLTETSPVVATEDDKFQKPGTIGLALPSLEVKIDNPDEQGVGELLVKGPSVMKGYYNDDKENAKVFTQDGFFRTGDLATIDKAGFITITGRVKYVIVLRNGKNIYPEEIETLINKIPGVAESMVYGIPDERKEYVLGAKIVYDKDEIGEVLKLENPSQETIETYFNDQVREKVNHKMPAYKYIKNVIVTDEPFEKTTTQKIKRNIEEKKILDKQS